MTTSLSDEELYDDIIIPDVELRRKEQFQTKDSHQLDTLQRAGLRQLGICASQVLSVAVPHTSSQSDTKELDTKQGDLVLVLETSSDWCLCRSISSGMEGWVPKTTLVTVT